MDETDAWMTLISFYEMIINDVPRPDFDWEVKNGVIHIETSIEFPPLSITLWQATNPNARNFQVDSIGRAYVAAPIKINSDGHYEVTVDEPSRGYAAFFAELEFPGVGDIPLKLTTGVVVTPDTYPFEPFRSDMPKGTAKIQ
jgi:PhoPQ-activated pathogenicity-related protein